MDRREWLKRAALIATGTVAADQLELLDRLGWVRRLFPSAAIPPTYLHQTFTLGFTVSKELLEDDGFIWPQRIMTASEISEYYHFPAPRLPR